MKYLSHLSTVSCAILVLAISAHASVETLSPEQELRYYNLLNELRCLVCQNQSLADSNSGLASDLRKEVLRMLEEGTGNEEIFAFMTNRYGNFVRYRPPFNMATAALWTAPFILLLIVFTALYRHIRREQQRGEKQ